MLSETSLPPINDKSATPLPLRQILCLLLLAVAEAIYAMQPSPYIPKLVEELDIIDGDKSKVGYYAGLFDTAYSITEAMFVLQWSCLSDRIGRKPVLLFGIMGQALSATLFGMSKTYATLIFSRALAGVLSANFTILRGTMAELLDTDSFARVIPWLAIMWSAGATIGPLIGGTFYHPFERMPGTFGSNPFWQHYPYFLPCLIVAAICIATFLVALCFFREASKSRTAASSLYPPVSIPSLQAHNPSLRSLLTRPLVIILANCALYACLDVAVNSILPIYLSSPGELGGLGFNPSQIGIVMAIISVYNSLFQIFFFARIHARWGSRRMLQTGMLAFVALFLSFPLSVWTIGGDGGGIGAGTWVIMVLQIGIYPFGMMIASCLTILITAVAPPAALGTTNGLGHNAASVFRILGPAATTSLFALSVQKKLAGGCLVYYVACVIAIIGYKIGGLVASDRPTLQEQDARLFD
ncbi:MFS general substrate transporter [Hysterangium stoloniferum]|nr:MFS general substrate transporter [Hysterangium stoloniferum]